MIRKPSDEDFRESQAVKALRETRNITVAGAQGVSAGLGRLYLMWFGGIMAFGFTISLIGATGGVVLIPMVIGGVLYWRSRRAKEAKRMALLRAEPERLAHAAPATSGGGAFAFPPEVRREGVIAADIGAVVQQAAVLFTIGFLCMVLLRFAIGGTAVVLGMLLVAFAVLIGSRIVGDRKLIAWDTRKVRVWHLLSEGEMQWSDVADVTVEKAGFFDLATLFQSGTRRNIVLTAPVNRLGGPTTLHVPIRSMNLPQAELEALLRDLFCWRAAGQSIAPEAAAAERAPSPAPAVTPMTDPRESFDPDAIIARHLREREQVLAQSGHAPVAPVRPQLSPSSPLDQRPVFGRKRA